jgi:hypothetical protein
MLSSSLDAEIEIWYDLCFNFINVRLEFVLREKFISLKSFSLSPIS